MPIMSPIVFEIVARSRDIESESNVYVNRQKHIETIKYRNKVLQDEVPLAYIGYPYINYETEIELNSQLQYLPENRVSGYSAVGSYEILASNVFISNTLDFEITNETIEVSGNTEPLFYGMQFPDNVVDATLSSWNQDTYWRYDSLGKTLYSNGTSILDIDILSYKGITVNIRYSDNTVKTMLYSNTSLYREATFDDYDPDTLDLYPNRKVYSIDNLLDGRYRIILNGVGPFFVRPKGTYNITCEKERLKKNNEPWLLKILGGTFTRSVNAIPYKYRINEFERQTWFPRAPYVTLTGRAEKINNNTLVLDETHVVIDTSKNLHFSLTVRDEENIIVKAYTTNTRKVGRPYDRWQFARREVVWELLDASADYENGVVFIANTIPVLSTDNLQCQYVVEEKYYRYRKLNLNPTYNLKMNSSGYVVYVIPNTVSSEDSIQWVRYEKYGSQRVVESSNSAIVLGITIQQFYETYACYNIYERTYNENLFQYAVLCDVQHNAKFTVNKVLALDIRTPSKLKKEAYQKNPWAYWTSQHSHRDVELPDKKVLIFQYQDIDILAAPENIQHHVRENTDIGTLSVLEDSIIPRVKRVYVVNRSLYVECMEEPGEHLYSIKDTTGDYLLYQGAVGSTYARRLITIGPFELPDTYCNISIEIVNNDTGTTVSSIKRYQV